MPGNDILAANLHSLSDFGRQHKENQIVNKWK